jgi:hypothetical protein
MFEVYVNKFSFQFLLFILGYFDLSGDFVFDLLGELKFLFSELGYLELVFLQGLLGLGK